MEKDTSTPLASAAEFARVHEVKGAEGVPLVSTAEYARIHKVKEAEVVERLKSGELKGSFISDPKLHERHLVADNREHVIVSDFSMPFSSVFRLVIKATVASLIVGAVLAPLFYVAMVILS